MHHSTNEMSNDHGWKGATYYRPRKEKLTSYTEEIILQYVLDIWFNKFIRKKCKGEAYIVRYADDFVCCFEYENEAKAFYEALKTRLNKFSLQVARSSEQV